MTTPSPDMRSLHKASVWGLFDQDVTREMYAAWRIYANQAALASDFMGAAMQPEDQDLSRHGNIPELDQWVLSDKGQNSLLRLTQTLQNRIRACAEWALPAHDLRQILYKDATEGLRFASYEDPQGYKSAFIIPMFSHDIGRLLEGKFYHLDIPHDDWIPHSQLSYLMLREVLADFPEIPQRLKNHFLYAVLAHSGENSKTYMGRAVQTCDRMQMIGPEGLFRAVSYMVCLMGHGELAYPTESRYQTNPPSLWDQKSVISVMETIGRTMYPNIGEEHREWQNYMLMLNTAILYRMVERQPGLKQTLFAPETHSVPETSLGIFKRPLPIDNMVGAQELAEQDIKYGVGSKTLVTSFEAAGKGKYDLTKRLVELIRTPIGAAPLSEPMTSRIHRAVQALRPAEVSAFYAAVEFAAIEQRKLDRSDDLLLTQTRLSMTSSDVAKQIAAQAQNFALSGVIPLNQHMTHPLLRVTHS